jgi:hypothetical protein
LVTITRSPGRAMAGVMVRPSSPIPINVPAPITVLAMPS